MKRGEVWTVSGGADYANKPRPAVIVQEDSFASTNSVTICVFTTSEREASLYRLPVEPSSLNGLTRSSRLMVDKVSSVPRAKLGRRVGQLSAEDVSRLNQALLVFLGLARPVARS